MWLCVLFWTLYFTYISLIISFIIASVCLQFKILLSMAMCLGAVVLLLIDKQIFFFKYCISVCNYFPMLNSNWYHGIYKHTLYCECQDTFLSYSLPWPSVWQIALMCLQWNVVVFFWIKWCWLRCQRHQLGYNILYEKLILLSQQFVWNKYFSFSPICSWLLVFLQK